MPAGSGVSMSFLVLHASLPQCDLLMHFDVGVGVSSVKTVRGGVSRSPRRRRGATTVIACGTEWGHARVPLDRRCSTVTWYQWRHILCKKIIVRDM